MRARQVTTSLLKLAALCVAAWGLFALWHYHAVSTIVVPDDDDIQVQPRVTVQVGAITRATLRRYVTAYGTVECEPARDGKAAASASVTVPAAAMIADVNCVEGQQVEKGATLFTLDGRATDAAIALAKARYEAASQLADKNTAAAKSAAARPIDLFRAENARDLAKAELNHAVAQKDLLKIVAPLSGTIVQLAIHPGETAALGAPAMQIADMSRLTIAVAVPSSQLAAVKVGQIAEIESQTNPATTSSATKPTTAPAALRTAVAFVDPGVDPNSNMGSVDIALPPNAGLKLGQFVCVRIATDEHQNCLAVPVESVVKDANGNAYLSMVVRDFRWAVRQPVEVGIRDGDLVEVRANELKGGEDIVTVGAYALRERSMIEVLK